VLFRLADVKKTVRSRSDGQRYIHPKLLEPSAVAAQVSLALAYFASRLGRARHEVDPEMLVRFFGDPKVARGLVACLAATYHWRTQEFTEVLDERATSSLAALGLRTPVDLRLHLFDAVNAGDGVGYLPAATPEQREESLGPLARSLGLTPAKLDQLIALDAPENAVLVRVGPVPLPEHVAALYNYQALDAVLRNSVSIELEKVDPAGRVALEAACAAVELPLAWRGNTAWLHNRADAFGSYARSGLRLTRALYLAAATAPVLLTRGTAQVQVAGKAALYPLDRQTLTGLTGGTGAIYAAASAPDLRDGWDRRRSASVEGGAHGWRLLGSPEPLLSAAGLAVAPYACRRDEETVLLWPVATAPALDGALETHRAGLDILVIASPDVAHLVSDDLPYARQEDGVAGIVAALDTHWGGGRVAVGVQALEALLDTLAARRFVPEVEVAEALGCVSGGELADRLRLLERSEDYAGRGVYLAGLGLCTPDFAEEMRKGLRRTRRRRPAA